MKPFNVKEFKARKAVANKKYLGKMRSVQIWMNPEDENQAKVLARLDSQENKRQYITDLVLRDIEQNG